MMMMKIGSSKMPFDIQKALHLNKALEKKSFNFSRSDWAVMPKLDGWYVYLDCIEGHWQQLSSSAGREIPALSELSQKLKALKPTESSARFIFEATIPDTEFHIMNGILNRKFSQAENVVLNLHDIVFFDAPNINFQSRYAALQNNYYPYLKEKMEDVFELIPILEVTNDLEKFRDIAGELILNGEEGIIGKSMSAGYSFGKRNNDLLKLKAEQSLDCRIVNWFWSTGDKGNEAMNLTLARSNGIQFPVVVNSHAAIETILSENVVGKVVEVACMEELPSGMLRQPVFKDFRFNKTEID